MKRRVFLSLTATAPVAKAESPRLAKRYGYTALPELPPEKLEHIERIQRQTNAALSATGRQLAEAL